MSLLYLYVIIVLENMSKVDNIEKSNRLSSVDELIKFDKSVNSEEFVSINMLS